MAVRDWRHISGTQFYNQQSSTGFLSPTLIAEAGSFWIQPTTVVRQLLDMHITVLIPPGQNPSPFQAWWEDMNFIVGVGVDALGANVPLRLASPLQEKRITGTGSLSVSSTATTVAPDPNEIASFSLQKTIDTHGARKSPTPGTPPAGNLTFQLMPGRTQLGTGFNWEMQVFYYWRILFQQD